MAPIREILEHNARWVDERNKTPSRSPNKRIAIFTCMDTRLVEFLEPALGIGRGDAKIIKNAGNTLVDPGGGVVRSLVVAIYALGCEEVLVVGHRDCGMGQLDESALRQKMLAQGVPAEAIAKLTPNLGDWLGAFHDPVGNVERVVGLLRDNPLLPKTVPIHGLLFDPNSGRLDLLVDGTTAA
jgi:carbonic anhydrase